MLKRAKTEIKPSPPKFISKLQLKIQISSEWILWKKRLVRINNGFEAAFKSAADYFYMDNQAELKFELFPTANLATKFGWFIVKFTNFDLNLLILQKTRHIFNNTNNFAGFANVFGLPNQFNQFTEVVLIFSSR